MKKVKKEKNKNPRRVLILLGLFLLLIGLFMFFVNLYGYNEPLLKDKQLVTDFFKEKNNNSKSIKNYNSNNDYKKIEESENDINYIAVLEIPSISLKTGLVSLMSLNNDVDKRVQIINGSQMLEQN